MASSSSNCGKLALWTSVAVLLQILGLFLFVYGFFPVKPALSGSSGPEGYQPPCDSPKNQEETMLSPEQLRSLYKEMSAIPPSFDRLILMVVDGLPAEFLLGRGDSPPTKSMMEAMPYTQFLLSNGSAIGYHAKAAPPTVTMPRLKAMVSGAIGGFLDVALNFHTQALLDDNLLGQLHKIGWNIVMFGDETWIRLFPGLFTRHDGVSSFYVKDTIEVDHNVSRHLEVELAASDWDFLILHYLGLDHVGHTGGRHSILMLPKLKEMDEAIKKLHVTTILHQQIPDIHTLLMVVSDHGMTESGNHGGSSFEETDTLALFIGLDPKVTGQASIIHNAVFQVDIVPTLALLLGVPIPNNNVGIPIAGLFGSLTDEQWLRALELNSWQLLRLLQAQLPSLSCRNTTCMDFSHQHGLEFSECNGSIEARLCCLFAKAVVFHSSWKCQKRQSSRSPDTEGLQRSVKAYYAFLQTAAEWLSQRTTDRALNLLGSGIALMILSCVMLLSLLFHLCNYPMQSQGTPERNDHNYQLQVDEYFALIGLLIYISSLGASSMVEEEQYTWHFLTSTFYLIFLRRALQFPPVASCNSSITCKKKCFGFLNYRSLSKKNWDGYFQIFLILAVLICGRILRGWHQGGVNWTNLQDISKWLELTGSLTIRSFQIASVILVISLGLFSLYLVRSRSLVLVLGCTNMLISGFLILLYIVEYQNHEVVVSNYAGTVIAQIIYATLGLAVTVTASILPWVMPISSSQIFKNTELCLAPPLPFGVQTWSLLSEIRDCTYSIGTTYICCWCLLQLLLQQPINAVPVFLLLMQLLATVNYFSTSGAHHKQWVEVTAINFLGMSGHFGLGNSNTLATVDVAGAYTGISTHSTFLAGILVFIITYASPLLFLLGTMIYIAMKNMKDIRPLQDADFGRILQTMIGVPCLIPLAMNSIVLTAFTFILLLMRNHLFVWSVFSPKYLYVCAATVSVYIGVCAIAITGLYTFSVFFLRSKMLNSKVRASTQSSAVIK